MAETNQAPLWLDLKKEYIDDNFNKRPFRTWSPIPATMQTTKEGLWAGYHYSLQTTKNKQ